MFTIQGDRLVTKVRLNYEAQTEYTVNVTVRDKNKASLTQAVAVRVLDVNDPPSDILLPPGVAVAENAKVYVTVQRYMYINNNSNNNNNNTNNNNHNNNNNNYNKNNNNDNNNNNSDNDTNNSIYNDFDNNNNKNYSNDDNRIVGGF